MKLKPPLILAYATAMLWGCSSTTYNYTQDPVHTYSYDNGKTKIEGELAPLHYDLETFRPIGLSLRFSHNLVRAESLKSVQVKLFSQDKNGQFTKEIPRGKFKVTAEYWNGKTEMKVVKENYEGEFHSLIDPDMKNYPYRDSNIVVFEVENEYTGLDHPDKLEQRIVIEWMDGSQENYTIFLTRTMHSKSCISGRPFG